MTHLTASFENSLLGNSEEARRQHWFVVAREQNEKREELTDNKERSAVAEAVDVVMASDARIRAFSEKLDQYDTATVNALMLNQKQLDEVQAHIQVMLEQAYIMEDGRRVFKSEDGTWAIDCLLYTSDAADE